MVDLAGYKPAIRHRQSATAAGGLVHQQRLDRTHAGVGDGPAERPPAHAPFHGSHVEVFAHDVAVGARQLGGELVGGFPP